MTPYTQEEGVENCGCRQCLKDRDEHVMWGSRKVPIEVTRMIVCGICGNKRCPHANDHRHACTGSNEAGQPGSAYPKVEFPASPSEEEKT